jgi:ubiquinone/menaquinone biosynthesis C-methylase UbiE
VHTVESKYVEKPAFASKCAQSPTVALREFQARLAAGSETEWLSELAEEWLRVVPYLRKRWGVDFRGRILEIGAGGAWLSAELSKLPKVVEVIATDLSPRLLQEEAPKVFVALKAHAAKITRMPADFHDLDFPDNYFDYVVCSAVLQHASSVVQVLREAKRVLKPGGQLVAVREPIWPLVKFKSREQAKPPAPVGRRQEPLYTLAHYRELFKQAGLPLEVKRVNLSRGFKYYVNEMVNGLTHARYAFIGTKRSKPAAKVQK